MDSSVTLKITDPSIEVKYLLMRNQDVKKFTIFIYVMSLIFHWSGLLNNYFFMGYFDWINFANRLIPFVLHIVLIIGCFKFPLKLIKWHGGLLVLIHSSVFIYTTDKPLSEMSPHLTDWIS